ncbi:MAG: DNA/RNA non-specific endonuclease [Saprospiraceae bacterium]|nr:DNA/RNA non-specific endonuclease [Saprospiraceae bacterium]
MAKFRQNHTRHSKGNAFAARAFIITIILVGILLLGFVKISSLLDSPSDKPSDNPATELDTFNVNPEGSSAILIKHNYFNLGYNEKNEQADWVAYKLTKKSIQVPNVPRAERFNPDYDVHSRSAYHRDYTRSGYTRGHLAPAGDMAFNELAMQESFLMSNISPQLSGFNGGIWRELEESVRDWAYDRGIIYITTGPIFYSNTPKSIGENKVAVPDAFYKAILDVNTPRQDAVAFIIPHAVSTEQLDAYMVPIDDLEALLGIDFFPHLYIDENEEHQLESQLDKKVWPLNKKRYQKRINVWNKN